MIDQADFLKTTKKDTKLWARFTKRAAHILLISAFALSVFSIFATTVTGTMLKSLGDRDIAEEYEETISPMGFLHKNLPFEFLISRFSFLQGLLHWIAGLALMYIGNAPAAGGKASTKMFYFIGTSLMSALLLMIAFLNKHMNFYASYLHMIADFHLQFFQQYFLCTPVRKSNPRVDRVSTRHRRDSTQVHARAADGVARGRGLHALVQVFL